MEHILLPVLYGPYILHCTLYETYMDVHVFNSNCVATRVMNEIRFFFFLTRKNVTDEKKIGSKNSFRSQNAHFYRAHICLLFINRFYSVLGFPSVVRSLRAVSVQLSNARYARYGVFDPMKLYVLCSYLYIYEIPPVNDLPDAET